jgi:hypothetical protein
MPTVKGPPAPVLAASATPTVPHEKAVREATQALRGLSINAASVHNPALLSKLVRFHAQAAQDGGISQLEKDLLRRFGQAAAQARSPAQAAQVARLLDLATTLATASPSGHGPLSELQRKLLFKLLDALAGSAASTGRLDAAIQRLQMLCTHGAGLTEASAQQVLQALSAQPPRRPVRKGGPIGGHAGRAPTPAGKPLAPTSTSPPATTPSAAEPQPATTPSLKPPRSSTAGLPRHGSGHVARPLEPGHTTPLSAQAHRNQLALLHALQKLGASSQEIKAALSIQLTESSDCISRDRNKDGRTDGSRNYGPLNMNEDMLRRHWTGDPNRLNLAEQLQQAGKRTDGAWDVIAQAFLACYRGQSADQFARRHRDGYGTGPDTSAQYLAGMHAQGDVLRQFGLGHRANVHVEYRA